ncbi:ABC transporter ATP-binding protein [Bifidobacterium porcinum]|uniref:ABC transporter ATP-binding protein n=1 Tax=Bifidobacterium porcinum TaxID=212365 RepID=UPI000ADB1ADD
MSTQNTTKPMDAAKPDDVSVKPGTRTSVSGAGRKPRPKVPRGTVKRLWGYISQYPVRLVIVVLSIIVSAAAQALSIAFLQRLVDTYIIPLVTATHPDWGPLIRALTLLAIMYAVGTFCAWLWGWLIIDIEQGTLKKIRDDMFAHQQRLPIRYFDTHEHGDVMSRYTNDTDTLRQAISQSFPQMFSSLLSALASLIAMMWLSVPFALFTLAFAIILFVFVNKLVARSGSQFVRQQRVLGDVNGFVEEAVNGQKVIKVFNHEDATQREFDRRNAELFDAAAKANTYGNITMPIVNNSGYLLYVATAILGAWAGLSGMHNFGFGGAGTMTLGTVIAMLTLSRGFINPLGQVSMQFTMVMMALAGASRIFALMDEPVEADGGTVTLVNVELGEDGRTMTETDRETQHWAWKRAADDDGTRSLAAAAKLRGQAREVAAKAKESAITSPDGRYTLLRGDVRFTDVTFGYDPSKPVLHDITWFAKPGQKVALVGATGAGKTTVTNLINRFYDIQEGQILYDGIDVRNIRKPDLRRSLGIVLQDVNLFTGTVMDNIRYGRLDATDEECIEAAKRTNADGFIRMLPEGYHTVLSGDGSGLSQGQRQLISIARAAVADPPAMILDEATSSIDTRTEEVVQAGMDALMKGRTVFVIAHRLSTVRNADVIMVLDHGRIIERGNHDELIAQRGEYYQLYTGALELE